jgi:sugar phosphate isomerase/epimerase
MIDTAIGISTGCFYRRPILEVLKPIRDSGFTLLEIASARQHLDFYDPEMVQAAAERLGALGLEACSYHGPFGVHLDISSPDDNLREKSIAEILASLQAAALLGVRYFTLHPGPDRESRAPAAEVEQRRETACRSLSRIAGECRERGLMLLLENQLPHQAFGRIDDLLWFRESITGSEAGFCFDTGHAKLAGDVYQIAERLAASARVIHAHDNRGADDHLPPGRNGIDWARLLKTLARSGFNGLISLELSGEHDQEPAEYLQEACRARTHLEEIFLQLA